MSGLKISSLTVDDIRELKWEQVSGLTYKEREIIGRAIFASICNKHYRFTKGEFDSWDVSTTGKTNTFNIEIKYRYILREKYDEDGYWLEEWKYNELMEAYRETGSIPYFITFLRDGVGYVWNLLDLDPVFEKRLATKSTANGTYGKEKKFKSVCYPMPSEGKEIRW